MVRVLARDVDERAAREVLELPELLVGGGQAQVSTRAYDGRRRATKAWIAIRISRRKIPSMLEGGTSAGGADFG
jgi:hypothetical protein